ncbi:MAG TPA: hypothetical protein VFW40_01955 [Capsulimonadaceae bacterium]|nr:hypothetical protein [Capsulimonadaceae bacterium]
MEARVLIIEERVKTGLGTVRPSDFRVRGGEAIDPDIVLRDPNLSLYCLDMENRQALFVETPPDCDLSSAPFFYQAQYEAAMRLVQIPYDTLHRLAAEVVLDPSRLMLIYSVGRCGSTLVSAAFNEVEAVDSISEPDVFTQMLGAWGPDDLQGGEKAQLLKSCTLLQCVPGQNRGATAWALKFRSSITQMGPLFYSVFPEAKAIFFYRNAEPWARSFLRVLQVADPSNPASMANIRALFGRAIPQANSRETASWLELLSWMWVATMESCRQLQKSGTPLFMARYEELKAAPQEVLAAMFAYCGLQENAVKNLDAVLERDSQEGSSLSRAVGAEAPLPVTREHMEELNRLISEGSQGLKADTILPNTYFPESAK